MICARFFPLFSYTFLKMHYTFDGLIDFNWIYVNCLYMWFFIYNSTGWQYRWFTVDAQTGILRYFLPTNNWSSSSTNNIADTHSTCSGNRSIDFDAISTSSGFNADSPTSNHIGTTPRWQVCLCDHFSKLVLSPKTIFRSKINLWENFQFVLWSSQDI